MISSIPNANNFQVIIWFQVINNDNNPQEAIIKHSHMVSSIPI